MHWKVLITAFHYTVLNLARMTKLEEWKVKPKEHCEEKIKNIRAGILTTTDSSPWKFYGTAKENKMKENANINLLIRPTESNINIWTYYLAKHLSKSLSTLRVLDYVMENAKKIMNDIDETSTTSSLPSGLI